MADLSVVPFNEGRVRAVDSLLRSQGGMAVSLRLPVPAQAGADNEQLGLSTPKFTDVPLAPALMRRSRASMTEGQASQYELLLSALAVGAVVSAQEVASSDVLFAMAAGLVIDGVLFLIEATAFTEWQGRVCMYRLLLRESVSSSAEQTVGS